MDIESLVLESPYPTFNAWYGRGWGADERYREAVLATLDGEAQPASSTLLPGLSVQS